MASRRYSIPRGEKTVLERFLLRSVPGADDARVRQWLGEGRVRVNGKVARAGRKTWGGETVELDLPTPAAPPRIDGPDIALLAKTPDVLIVDKPSGFTVEPEPGQISVVELVASQHGPFDVAGTGLPGVAHRLDKDTSGCLAFGRTDAGLLQLTEGFELKRIDKRYLAFVAGAPPPTGQLDQPYAKGPDGRYTTRLASARRARLSWKVVSQWSAAALVEIVLDTGRTHQIRVQLSEAGFPVLGDRLYGQPFSGPNAPRLALHAARLSIEGTLTAESPLPDTLVAFRDALAR